MLRCVQLDVVQLHLLHALLELIFRRRGQRIDIRISPAFDQDISNMEQRENALKSIYLYCLDLRLTT